MLNKLKALCPLLIVFILFILISTEPWERQPVVFYDPLILPVEVIKGDIIIFFDERRVAMRHDMTVEVIEKYNDRIVVKGTRHLSLWEMLFK